MDNLSLNTPLTEVSGIGPAYVRRLEKLGLFNIGDLLLYFPRTYEDLSYVRKIFEMSTLDTNTIQGKILNVKNIHTRNRRTLTKATFADDTGSIEVVWFNQPFLKDSLKVGQEYILSGKIKLEFGKVTMQNPVHEPVKKKQIHTARIVPIYSETEGVTSRWLRFKIGQLLPLARQFVDILPKKIREEESLMPFAEAVETLHFPRSNELLQKARERIAFEELFVFQLSALKRKLDWKSVSQAAPQIPLKEEIVRQFVQSLPFTLTDGQKISAYEILKDMAKDSPMLRLLEGDVGSGKTIVATIAMLNCAKNGYQSALMAPTEILAQQHYGKIVDYVKKFGLNMALLVGSTPAKAKTEIKNKLATGVIDIVIGTHALLQEDVTFSKLGLAVIDEQHRFGVEQRARLKEHDHPHILNMTATPIPRSLALTIYGDQDVSIIAELPPGRVPIITRVVPPKERQTAYLFVRDQILKGRQAFVICPLIEESDVLGVRSVKEEYARLSTKIYPDLKLAMLHGKLRPKEKAEIMRAFAAGETHLLVSTSVVEVGVDIPNATMMLIEGADRFGLAQLHQFRGRVGRGDKQSYCLLFTEAEGRTAKERLKAMERYTDGFKLSEIDLKLRGPGEVFGTRQSGIPDLKMAQLTDKKMVYRTRKWAEDMIAETGDLDKYPDLAAAVKRLNMKNLRA